MSTLVKEDFFERVTIVLMSENQLGEVSDQIVSSWGNSIWKGPVVEGTK